MFQALEMSLIFLDEHPDFITSEGVSQPLLPDATKIQETHMSHAIIFLEACKKQNDIFAGEDMSNNSATDVFDANVDLDVLVFRGDSHKSASNLTIRVNPHARCKCAKEQHDISFNSLSSLGLDNVTTVASRSKKKVLGFEKLPLVDIASDPVVLDKCPKIIKFSEHESNII